MHLDPAVDLQADGFDPTISQDDMSKKKRRAQRPTPTDTTAWSDLERAFFESAPPDEPQPSAEASSFDDLLEAPARRRRKPRTVAIVLAAVALLIGLGLSAAVLAAR
jgi:hypothetical protein